MEKYEILSQVGKGSFGQVYMAKRRTDGEIVAFKVIKKCGRSIEDLKSLRRECEIQQYLCHPNIIRMLDSFETDNEIAVITEYADKELYEILAKTGRLSEERAQVIACDLVSALFYLHSNRILHRDLKPQNVLIDADGVAKLCDFGFARSMSNEVHVLTSIKGTPLYMAPELIEEYPYDHNVDLWSLGCIIYELITGIPPFPTSSIVQLIKLIRHETIKWPTYISLNCKSFLQGLLQKDPLQRLTWPNLLQHPFVKDRILIVKENNSPLIQIPFAFSQICREHLENQKRDSRKKNGQKTAVQIHKLKGKQKQLIGQPCYSIVQDYSHSSEIHYEKLENSESYDADFISSIQILNNCKTDLKSSVDQFNSFTMLPGNNIFNGNGQNKIEHENSIHKSIEVTDLKLMSVNQAIENEEWIAFLQHSMEEIMDGEIDSLLQENCIKIFISPLTNPAASCQVIEYISCLLSLPFVLSISKNHIENILGVYYHVGVVPNLISAIKILMSGCIGAEISNTNSYKKLESQFMLSADKLQALEYTLVLVCRLLYMQEKFVKQFCNTVYTTNELQLFHSLLSLERRKSRIAADLIAILIQVLQTPIENTKIVEKILLEYQPKELIDLFTRLMTHKQSLLRSRTCTLICLLGKFKCDVLQQIWGQSMRNLLNALTTDDDITVRKTAEDTYVELKQIAYFNQEIKAG